MYMHHVEAFNGHSYFIVAYAEQITSTDNENSSFHQFHALLSLSTEPFFTHNICQMLLVMFFPFLPFQLYGGRVNNHKQV